MLVMGVHTGHDGAVAVVQDRKLLFCLEAEKDSFPRHAKVTPMGMLDAIERIGQVPDVISVGGSLKSFWGHPGYAAPIESGYWGGQATSLRDATFFGKPVKMFSSSHIRTHIMGAAGMAPPDDAELRAVLVWEGDEGSFYLLDERWVIVREIPVLRFPGGRYALAFAIADPSYADRTTFEADGDNSGKLMALAAYGDPAAADRGVVAAVDRLLDPDPSLGKSAWIDSPLYNAGVESDVTKTVAALLQQRMFELFAGVAQQELPHDIPLYIAGGCGLNCDWNTMWRELGHFSSVFVPPCPNDAGSALGTTLDALHAVTGDPRVEWDVYCGLEFEWDQDPDPAKWQRRPMQEATVADALASGRVVAWVQGRWELGPRALGNRSLLAEPFDSGTRDCLNKIKQREGYRPIAPICRIEDAGDVFDKDFHDPYMLHFRMVTAPDLNAITHVDSSTRAQTVTRGSNRVLHDLLSAFGERHGVGVLCNTSLNYKGKGFINRTSDLADYCERRGIPDMVVGDAWYQRVEDRVTWERSKPFIRPLAPRLVKRLVQETVPAGATVLVIADGSDATLDLDDRREWHFSGTENGRSEGHDPRDSSEAISGLEQLRGKGASHLVITNVALWWLDLYPGFRQHLERRYTPLLRRDGVCAIFQLQDAEAAAAGTKS